MRGRLPLQSRLDRAERMRDINAAGLDLVKRNEGLRLNAYKDVAGIWTIGYGHTPSGKGRRVSEAEAERLLKADLASAEQAVDAATHDVNTNDNQFSAMVSLAFNIGNAAFRGSSVLREHRAGHYGIAAAFLMWDKSHVNGELVVVPGLHRRRARDGLLELARQCEAAAEQYGSTDGS